MRWACRCPAFKTGGARRRRSVERGAAMGWLRRLLGAREAPSWGAEELYLCLTCERVTLGPHHVRCGPGTPLPVCLARYIRLCEQTPLRLGWPTVGPLGRRPPWPQSN